MKRQVYSWVAFLIQFSSDFPFSDEDVKIDKSMKEIKRVLSPTRKHVIEFSSYEYCGNLYESRFHEVVACRKYGPTKYQMAQQKYISSNSKISTIVHINKK